MFRTSLFLVLGLMAAVTLGCEKKEEAPATPDAGAVEEHADEAHDAASDAMDEAKDAVDEAADETKEAVEEGADAAKKAMEDATN